jgi:hypothetical protein
MFKLPWSLPPVDRELLRKYLDKMYDRSMNNDIFIVHMPKTVYEHIKARGINANLIEMQSQASPGMIWIEVRKMEKPCEMNKPYFEKELIEQRIL